MKGTQRHEATTTDTTTKKITQRMMTTTRGWQNDEETGEKGEYSHDEVSEEDVSDVGFDQSARRDC